MLLVQGFVLHIEGSQPEWCISSMMYSTEIPFWSETFDMNNVLLDVVMHCCLCVCLLVCMSSSLREEGREGVFLFFLLKGE